MLERGLVGHLAKLDPLLAQTFSYATAPATRSIRVKRSAIEIRIYLPVVILIKLTTSYSFRSD